MVLRAYPKNSSLGRLHDARLRWRAHFTTLRGASQEATSAGFGDRLKDDRIYKKRNEMLLTPRESKADISLYLMVPIILIGTVVYLSGIQQDLPYFAFIDETLQVAPVVRMVVQDTLNPSRFAHPASTTMYPLYFIYQFWQALSPAGYVMFANIPVGPELIDKWVNYYFLGRLLSIGYATVSLPLIYVLGKRAFGTSAGLVGTFLFIFYPVVVQQAQYFRTDSATVFWGGLSLWLCLKLYGNPSTRHQIFAGVAIGLAIATKYYLVVLVPVWLTVNFMILKNHISDTPGKKLIPAIILGFLLIPATFILSTPYFFLDFQTVLLDLAHEARDSHPAFESLSPLGNLSWYLTNAIPRSMSWYQAVLTLAGIVLITWRRDFRQLLLLEYAAIFLVSISFSSGLHWQRWLIPILPILALFAAFVLVEAVKFSLVKLHWSDARMYGLFLICAIVLSYPHISALISRSQYYSRPDTRLRAGLWVQDNLPAGSKIIQEEFRIPINEEKFEVRTLWSISETEYTLDDAYRAGYRYIIVNSHIYDMYFSAPQRHSRQIKIYQNLFDELVLLKEFAPTQQERGPTIKLYQIPER